MIKTIVFLTKVAVATIASLLFASCMISNKNGDGNLRTETRTIAENFTKVDVSNAIHVTLVQDNATEVTVEADNNLLPVIETYVENGTLYIKSNEGYSTENDVNVHIKMPKIEGLRASSSSSIRSDKKIITDKLEITAESAAQIEGEAEADDLQINASSGSSVDLKGKALKLSATAASGSEIKTGSLMANEITSDASSGSSVEVMPILSLNAQASSGASIHYNKEPKTKSVSESSGGSVSN